MRSAQRTRGSSSFAKSPRNIEPDDAGRLADSIRGKAKIVAVTVDADNDDLDEIVAALNPDILQLHGSETPGAGCLTVKAVYGLPVMKALSIRDADDLKQVEPYIGIADRFLFDAKPPAGSELPGGNGVSFDWKLLDALDGSVDYMLSGGLNVDNIGEALAQTRRPRHRYLLRRRERAGRQGSEAHGIVFRCRSPGGGV